MPPAGSASLDQKALGLVDELDDPSPGHLSDHPQALSATTSLSPATATKQLSLGDRFVKASEESTTEGAVEQPQPQGESSATPSTETEETTEMAVDDPEKENRAG